LALQVANRIAADPTKRGTVKGVAAVVPVTLHYDNVPEEFKSIYKAYQDNEKGEAVLDIDSMKNFFAVAGVEDPKDSDFFTALATANHKNFPPTYFASCEYDILRDDAYVMEAALKKAGVPTKHDHYKGFPHYFWIFPSIPESKQFVENLINGLKWLVAQTQDD
jgi:versiconal hemiacetal acetate esterase